jgi:hypothetical protein
VIDSTTPDPLSPDEEAQLKAFYDELLGNMAKLNDKALRTSSEDWEAEGRRELEALGFPLDFESILRGMNLLNQPDEDSLRRVSAAYKWIQRQLEGRKHESSLYLNMLDRPELLMHYISQAFLGGFLLARSREAYPRAARLVAAVPDLVVRQAAQPEPHVENIRHNFYSAIHQGLQVVKRYLAELAGGMPKDEGPLAPGADSKLVH